MKIVKVLLCLLLLVVFLFLTLYMSALLAGFDSITDMLGFIFEKARVGDWDGSSSAVLAKW